MVHDLFTGPVQRMAKVVVLGCVIPPVGEKVSSRNLGIKQSFTYDKDGLDDDVEDDGGLLDLAAFLPIGDRHRLVCVHGLAKMF